MRYRILIIISLFVQSLPAQDPEKGNYPIYNFSTKDYNASDQNWAIVKDTFGLIYVGNNQGLLIYDGKSWEQIKTSNNSYVKSLDISKDQRVFAGALDDFGYITNNSSGKFIFHSLLNLLPDTLKSFGDVWKTLCLNDRTIFQTSQYIFEYNDDSEPLRIFKSEDHFHNAFRVDNRVVISKLDSGLFVLDDKITFIDGSSFFINKGIYGIEKGFKENEIIIATASKFFKAKIDFNSKRIEDIIEFDTQADSWFNQYDIYCFKLLNDGTLSVGTWGGGLVLLDYSGILIDIINNSSGLQDQIVQNQFADENKTIWISLGSGISRIEAGSPITFYDETKGLKGTVQSISRFDRKIFVSTTLGLFYLENDLSINPDHPFSSRFIKVNDFDFETWDLLTFQTGNSQYLLVATNDQIWQFDRNLNKRIIYEDYYIIRIFRSRLDPNRIFIGTNDGLRSIYCNDNNWRKESDFKEISTAVNSINEDHQGNLWIGSLEKGVYKLYISKLDHNSISEYTVKHYVDSLPEGPFVFELLEGKVMLGTDKGIFRYYLHLDNFVIDTIFGQDFISNKYWIYRFNIDKSDNLWVVTYSEKTNKFNVGYFKRNDRSHYHSHPFTKVSESAIHSVFSEENITWMGGADGLFRFDLNKSQTSNKIYKPIIRKVEASRDSIIYNPDIIFPNKKFILDYGHNDITFNYAALNATDENYIFYSYILKGYDQEWSGWTSSAAKEYTNLREGDYAFCVKAKDVNNNESEESSFQFTITPPWYRKWYSILAYLFILIGIVYLIIFLYTRNLRAIIKARTAEIVKQKNEIELKNQEITDSINYAKLIQEAVLPPESYIADFLPEHFIIYLPKDIVSGDFYWVGYLDGKTAVAVADCTGHGVPGAFMSFLGLSFFNEQIRLIENPSTNVILERLRSYVIKSLHQIGKEGENKDGMDISLCLIDRETKKIQFSGANRPLFIISNDRSEMYKGDRIPVGIHEHANEPFTSLEINYYENDMIYMFSDGFPDQFGGKEHKKIMIKRLIGELEKVSSLSLQDQKQHLENFYFDWKKDTEQIDDVILLGIRL